jgi:hypothetical protein
MNFVLSVASYIVALAVIALVGAAFDFAAIAFIPLLRRARSLVPAFSFVISSAGTFFGIWIFAAIASRTPLRASVAMIALPALLTYLNDRQRIQKVLAGISGTKLWLAQHREPESYDQRGDLWNERAQLAGHLVGFSLGFSLFLGHERFF